MMLICKEIIYSAEIYSFIPETSGDDVLFKAMISSGIFYPRINKTNTKIFFMLISE